MPSIDPAARAALLGPIGTCPVCGRERVRHYCRTPGGILAIPDFDNFPIL